MLTKKGRIKLADFGFGTLFPECSLTHLACLATPSFREERKSFVGTVHWMAPEIINATELQRPYTFAVGTIEYPPPTNPLDIWSLGVTSIECAECGPPDVQTDVIELLSLRCRKKRAPQLKEDPRWSESFHSFTSACLHLEASNRPTARMLLKHPWFKSLNRKYA